MNACEARTVNAGKKVARKAPVLLEPFDYEGVTLLPGRFRDQAERAREIYGGLSEDGKRCGSDTCPKVI